MAGTWISEKVATNANDSSPRHVLRLCAFVLGLLVCCCSCESLLAADGSLRVRKVFEKSEGDVPVQMGDRERGPDINRGGDILFGVSGVRDEGMWSIPQDGPPVCIAKSDQLPGLDAVPLSSHWRRYVLNDAGMAAFYVSIRLPSPMGQRAIQQTSGIWSYEPGIGLNRVVLDGDLAVGLEDKQFDLSFLSLFLSQTGQIGFQTTVNPTDETEREFGRSDESGFWIWKNGQLESIGPIHDAGAASVMNARGHVARPIRHRSPYSEIVVFANGTERIAVAPRPLLDPPGIERLVVTGMNGLGFNNTGQVAFETRACSEKESSQTSWRDGYAIANPGVLEPQVMHLDGMKIDGQTVGKVDGNSFTLLNARGDFASSERNHYLADGFHGICYAPHGGTLRIVADAQNLAPGVDAVFAAPAGSGFINGALNASRLSYVFANLVLNARGQLAFTAHLGGNVTPENNRGLWATQTDAQNVQLIARTGDKVQVADGDIRTIKRIAFAGPSGNEDSRPSGMNDDGLIVFAVAFTDGSAAVIESDAVAGEAGVGNSIQDHSKLAIEKTVNRTAASAALAKWEEVAKLRIAEAKKELQDSDNEKLTRLAQSLREEYKTLLAEAIAWQIEQPRAVNGAEQDPAHRDRLLRLQHLPQIWEGLAQWPYDDRRQDTTTKSQREFETATSQLLGKYGEFDSVSNRVASVQQELKRFTIGPLIRKGNGQRLPSRDQLFRSNREGLKLNQFSEPIGQELPEALNDQPQAFPTEGAVDGPLVQLKEQIRPLVKLAMREDGRLELDHQHWSKPTARLNAGQLTSAVVSLLVRAQIDERLIGSHYVRRVNRGGHAIIGHFETLKIAATALSNGGGGGGSRRGDRFDRQIRTKVLTARVIGNNDGADLEIELTEKTGPERKLTFATSGESYLLVDLKQGDTLNRLVQEDNGKVKLLTGSIEDLQKFSADSFGALLKAHENEVREALLQPLQTFGVLTP